MGVLYDWQIIQKYQATLFMKNTLTQALIPIEPIRYIKILIVIAPLLNFLSGINFDLHAPSLPAIANYFDAPMSAAKNTITVSMFGFGLGSLVFGLLLDIYGRRGVILFGLCIYTIVSFLALACSSIEQLLLVRFLQGFSVSSLSIGCRTIIIDSFQDHQFKVALLYTSLAFGIGPIIAPFVGGILQVHFGWQANFIAYGLVSFSLLIMFYLYVNESQPTNHKSSVVELLRYYVQLLRHRMFVPGVLIGGLSQMQTLTYTTVGAFLIENVLHHSAITYGNSALLISCGYLSGTLCNRLLIKHWPIERLIHVGFLLLFASMLLQIVFALSAPMNLFTIILPITLIGFSNGFIFINVLACCLQLASSAGITTALFTAVVMLIGAIGTTVISYVSATNLWTLAIIYSTTILLQAGVFYRHFKHHLVE